jgi:hypothetical protein
MRRGFIRRRRPSRKELFELVSVTRTKAFDFVINFDEKRREEKRRVVILRRTGNTLNSIPFLS